ncbi:zf-DNL-domain-containing protein, partial [Patellaria atrata CBS 101060]
MSFTCRKCHERSSHKVSKQGYHHGTVLITCTGCKNKHLISDHLKIFSDTGITIEEILTKKGETIQK